MGIPVVSTNVGGIPRGTTRAHPSVDDQVAKCYLSAVSQPVKLSDALVLDARVVGRVAKRSIAGQIEFWATLGRALEPLLQGATAHALARSGGIRPLSELLDSVDAPAGRGRLAEYLAGEPWPHFEAAADAPGLLVRIDADGTRTVGRFVNREFVVVTPKRR